MTAGRASSPRPAGRNASPRVAQMIETLQMGGAENLAVQIANALADRGLDSHLYVLVESGPLEERIDPRVVVRHFDIHRKPLRNLPGFAATVWNGYKRLRRAIRKDRIDLIQSHLPGANFWGLLMSLRRACRVVPTVHNNREFDYGDADNPLRARLRRLAYRWMIGQCDAMVAVSEQSRFSLLQALDMPRAAAPRLFAVPNGVVIPDAMTRDDRDALRGRHGCGERDVLLLAAGRHSEQKNFKTLIEALALLPGDVPPWRLVLAGDGPLREDHIRRAAAAGLEAGIEFPGVVTDLDRLMQAADIFVLPSLWEGLPLVLLEALACGRAVAGTRIDGISEVISDGSTGLLADPGDARQLSGILARLIASPDERDRLGRAALEVARGAYSLDRVVDSLLSIYTRGHPDPHTTETTGPR